MVETPISRKTKVTVPSAWSASTIVKGILSPSLLALTTTKFPGLAFTATFGARIFTSFILGAKVFLKVILYPSFSPPNFSKD
jgi:hypothetical protein